MSPQLHPAGFRISDRPVAASFAHPYSFQPVTDFLLRDEACLSSTSSLGGAEGSWVRYWDETSTAAVLEFKVEEPAQETLHSKEKRDKKKNKGRLHPHLVLASSLQLPCATQIVILKPQLQLLRRCPLPTNLLL